MGVYALALDDLFKGLAARRRRYPNKQQTNHADGDDDGNSVLVSFFELYRGNLYDLLARRAKLELREDGDGNVNVSYYLLPTTTTTTTTTIVIIIDVIARASHSIFDPFTQIHHCSRHRRPHTHDTRNGPFLEHRQLEILGLTRRAVRAGGGGGGASEVMALVGGVRRTTSSTSSNDTSSRSHAILQIELPPAPALSTAESAESAAAAAAAAAAGATPLTKTKDATPKSGYGQREQQLRARRERLSQERRAKITFVDVGYDK